jgi:hypothetical protein
MELFEEAPGLEGPPKATIAKRAKSYSDFYEIARNCLDKEAKTEKSKDALDTFESETERAPLNLRFEAFEDDLLDASQEEYQ